MSDMVLKYAYRYSVLEVEPFDSLREAVQAAHYASDAGTESLVAIEVLSDEGATVYDRDACSELMKPLERADSERYDAAPKAVAWIEIRSPFDDKEARGDAFATMEEATAERHRLAAVLGADRVRIVPLPRRILDPKPEWENKGAES